MRAESKAGSRQDETAEVGSLGCGKQRGTTRRIRMRREPTGEIRKEELTKLPREVEEAAERET